MAISLKSPYFWRYFSPRKNKRKAGLFIEDIHAEHQEFGWLWNNVLVAVDRCSTARFPWWHLSPTLPQTSILFIQRNLYDGRPENFSFLHFFVLSYTIILSIQIISCTKYAPRAKLSCLDVKSDLEFLCFGVFCFTFLNKVYSMTKESCTTSDVAISF